MKKKKPTPKAPVLKGSPMAMVKAQQEADAAYNAAMEEYNAQVAEAEEALSAWSGIYALMNGRKRAARERQEAEQRERDKQLHDEAVAQLAEAAAQVADGTKRDGENPSEAAAENGSVGLRNDGRGRVEGHSDQRQGDLAETWDVADNGVSEWYKNLRLSGELDQNNSPFILSPNGQIDFGQITEAHHLPAAPIRLSMGDMTNGYIHINRRHGKQIQKAGFDSIEAFVDYVVNNFTRIKEGASYENASGGKNNTYLIQLQDGHNNTLFVQLSRDGKYWNVNSAGVFGKKYGDKKEEIWSASEVQNDNSAVASDGLQSEPIADNGSTSNGTPSKNEEYNRHATAKQPVETAETSQGAEQSDTQEPSSMNVPTSSDGKDINKQTTLQENGGKSSENKGETPLSEQIATASAEVDTEPTEAQKEAGNYKKGHVQVGTFDITIEQPEGSVRKGTDADGKQWESKMHNTYGYFRGTEGVDGDHIDVFLSNDIDGWNGRNVYVVDQYNPDGTFDEHKVMLGFNDMDEAKSDYLANYEKGWEDGRRIVVSATNLEDFEKWIDSSHRKTKPFAEYAEVKKETVANAPAKEETTEHEGIFKMAERIAKEGKAERGKKNKASADVKTNSTEVRQKAKDGKPRLQKMDDSSVMDAEYFAAIERGDMEEAQRIVNEAAKRAGYSVGSDYQGTSAFNGAAPYGNGYFLTKEERKEAWDNGDFEGESTLGDYIDNGVDGGNLEELTNNSSYRHADDMRKEAIENVRDAIENGRNTITMYRSVPSSVQEGKFRNGDWITPSRKYAEDNAEIHGWGKDYRIIEQKVSVDDVWFDGNDIAEWGYGREKDYVNDTDFAYKNTENNRKLLDVITRDDGNIIPPSERFNRRKADERYQKGGTASRPTQAETALRDAVIDHLRENGMDVIDNDTEGQRVLDMVNGRGKLQMGDAPETFAERQKKAVENHGVVMPGLNETDVEVVKDIPRHRYTGGIAEATKQAVEKAKEKYAPGGKAKVLHYDNNGAEFDYVISGNAIEICLSPKHQAKSGNKGVHLALAEHLDEVINKSIEVEEHPDYIKDKDGKRGDEINPDGLMHRFYGVAIIDGVPCRVMTLMREDGRTEMDNGIHSYEVQKIEVLDKELPSTSNGVGKPINEISAYPLAKLLKGVEKAHDKGKNLLEESKKRLDNLREHRVYHGSGADFDAFDHSHMGEGEGAQAYGWGTYVTEVEGIGRTYAEQGRKDVPEFVYDGKEMDFSRLAAELSDMAGENNYGILTHFLWEWNRNGGHRAKEYLAYEIREAKYRRNHSSNPTAYDEEIAGLEALLKVKGIRKNTKTNKTNLYTIEIPEDNGKNYLDWNKPLPDGFDKEAVKERIMDDKRTEDELENGMMERDLSDGMDYAATGKDLYKAISLYVGDKAASEMLHDIGYVGIKYPADNMRGGRDDGAKNYVIFNEKDLKITDHVRFFRTADGEAYGFTVGGRIYIDPRIATSETPIHEYAHLWATALRNGNPKEWRNVVGLMKGTPVWDEVKKRYPELETDDEIADEVIAAYSGRRGAERLREEAKETADGDGGVFDKAKAVGALQRVKAALGKFWRAVADFLHIHYTSAEEVADRVMKDLLDGIDPRSMMDGGKSLRPDTEINVVEGAEEHGFKNYAEAKEWAKDHIVRTYNSEETSGKGDIRISRTAVDKYLSQSAVDKSESKDVHLSVLKVLPDVICESVDAEQHADYKKGEDGVRSEENGINPNVTIHRLYGAVSMDGRLYRVKVTLKEDKTSKEPKVPHSYEATKIELLAGTLGNSENSLSPNTNNSITAANLLKGVEKSYGGGRFFEDYNKIREQFIGEKGAERADHAEEVTTRLDNLSVAREMEAAKKDAKAIKMATGWERGADGKWRYEIPDLKYFDKGDAGYKKARGKQPWSKELDGLSDRIFDGGELSESEYQRFDELAQKEEVFKKDYLNREKPHLADWVENDELFKAYPDLQRVKLVFTDQLPANMGGKYNEREHTIVVNTNYVGDTSSVLAHEVQHAIQKIEGFARGGSAAGIDRGKAVIREVFDKISNGLDDAAKLRGIPTENEWLHSLDGDAVKVMEKQLKAYQGKNFALTRVYVDNVGFDNHDKELLHTKLDQANDIIEKQRKELGGTEYIGNSFEAYRRLGGEVESRNVEKRMGMAAEERRASLAAETEDVSREDQIFLMDEGEGDSYSLREADGEDETSEDKTKFRLLEDDDPKAIELESLPDNELVPVYRNVQAFEDDALGSPMAFTDAKTGERRTLQGQKWNYSNPPQIELTPEQQRQLDELNKNGYIVVDGKKTTELQINDGLKFVKPKTKDAQLQYFLKKNPEDKGLWAAYDPYDHAIETPLNTQFGEAYKRPNLVVVRSLIPKSEIDEPFHADYALLPTGAHQWNNGSTLYLSRWSKIDKVLTREEEAKLIDEYWKKHPGKREALKSHRDYNRFVPQVRRELEKMGYRFELDGKELTPEESLALDEQNMENRDVIPGREGHAPFMTNEDIARINAKMSGKWVGEPKEAMNNAMAERVNELAERLHTPVRIIRTDEEVAALPSARQRRMKGSFNSLTGEVTIVVPNNANMADVENTFLHEVVGHDGLHVLFPEEEKLNNALDELYRVSNQGIQQTIDRNAQKMYDAEVDRLREKKRKEHEANGDAAAYGHYYSDMAEAHAEAGRKRGQFRREATEEYGAELAGRIGESGFEKMGADELTFWGKLKAMLQKALQKLLDGLKIPGKKKWGDKEWAFVLHEAYKRKKNGGRPTVFDAADTEVMRRKTGFGDTKFSDGKNTPNESVDEINRTFNDELQQQIDGKLPEGHIYKMGKPGKVLLSTGVPNLPIQMNASRLQDKATMFDHDFNLTEVRDLVKALQHPLAVFAYGDKTKAQNIIVPLQKDGKNFIVGLSLNPVVNGRKLEINSIRNVFPKDNSEWLNWINQGSADFSSW